jgi:hypothetical protein
VTHRCVAGACLYTSGAPSSAGGVSRERAHSPGIPALVLTPHAASCMALWHQGPGHPLMALAARAQSRRCSHAQTLTADELLTQALEENPYVVYGAGALLVAFVVRRASLPTTATR